MWMSLQAGSSLILFVKGVNRKECFNPTLLFLLLCCREDQSVPTFTRTELKAFKDKGELKAEFKTGSVALDRLLELEVRID